MNCKDYRSKDLEVTDDEEDDVVKMKHDESCRVEDG
jgi:hypothetical protein